MYSYDDRIRAVKLYIKRLSGRFFYIPNRS